MERLIVYSVNVSLVVTAFFLTCAIFPIFFANDCLKKFLLAISGFLGPKLDTNDHFPMVEGSIS